MSKNLLEMILIFTIVLLALVPGSLQAQVKSYNIKAGLIGEDSEIIFETDEANIMMMVAMFSLHVRNEEGRCNIHLLRIGKTVESGVYRADAEEGPRVAVVCFIADTDVPERIVSESGEMTILEIDTDERRIRGHFELNLRGTISEKHYRFTGRYAFGP